jgi:hypothetical protein
VEPSDSLNIMTMFLVVPESATYEQQGIVYVYKIEKEILPETLL